MKLPPSIESIVSEHVDIEDFDLVGYTIAIAREACRLQREADREYVKMSWPPLVVE